MKSISLRARQILLVLTKNGKWEPRLFAKLWAIPEVRPEVLAAVRQLSPRQRAVVVLTYWEDLAPDEVASILGTSQGSVKQHLARARSKLRRVLDD